MRTDLRGVWELRRGVSGVGEDGGGTRGGPERTPGSSGIAYSLSAMMKVVGRGRIAEREGCCCWALVVMDGGEARVGGWIFPHTQNVPRLDCFSEP